MLEQLMTTAFTVLMFALIVALPRHDKRPRKPAPAIDFD